MSSVFRPLYVDWVSKTLLQSEQGGEFQLPAFFKYEGVPFKLYIVEPDTTQAPLGYSRVDISNLALRITLNSTLDDAAPEAEQQTWTKDATQNHFTGELSLNTAAMNAVVGSNTSVTVYFQIQVSESGGDWRTIYQQQVTVKNSITQPTTTQPDPVNTYRTAAESDLIYLSAQMRPGTQLAIPSENNQFIRIIGVDNNGTSIDTIINNAP